MPVFQSLASLAVAGKIDMELELKWKEDEKDGLRLLAFSPPQSPVNRHPVTGDALGVDEPVLSLIPSSVEAVEGPPAGRGPNLTQ